MSIFQVADSQSMWFAPIVVFAAATVSAALMVLLRRFLPRYGLAKPNARSSHQEPTPQGGGIAVVAATLLVAVFGSLSLPQVGSGTIDSLASIVTATFLIAMVGAIDDIRDLRVWIKLPFQALAVTIIVMPLSPELRLAPDLPFWLERFLLVIGGVYFVNVVNFMDGIDWLTVAEIIPITTGLAIMGFLGALPWPGTLIALALLGATIGFAPFNRPVAKIFLGDVGSLPIGLLLFGLLLILVAKAGHAAAAILLPLYMLGDATLTLLRRLLAGERFWEAHRTHFYQRATDRGFSVIEIDVRIFAVNLGLVMLALVTVIASSRLVDLMALAIGSCLVGWTLFSFAAGKPKKQSASHSCAPHDP